MFKFILIAAIFALASSQEVQIISQESDIQPDGSFRWSYDQSDGSSQSASGNENSVQGSASWTTPDGLPLQLTYTADENGFQPIGAHLPVPPPIPDAILRALEYNQAHPSD